MMFLFHQTSNKVEEGRSFRGQGRRNKGGFVAFGGKWETEAFFGHVKASRVSRADEKTE